MIIYYPDGCYERIGADTLHLFVNTKPSPVFSNKGSNNKSNIGLPF